MIEILRYLKHKTIVTLTSTKNIFNSMFLGIRDNKVIQLPEEKLKIINSLIDSIEVNDDKVIINTSKNIMLYNKGHFISVNKGLNISLADAIHLNPNITNSVKRNIKRNSISYTIDEVRKSEVQTTTQLESTLVTEDCLGCK